MDTVLLASIVLIIFAFVGVFLQKYGTQIKMRKCMKDPFYVYFFEDVKDFKNFAVLNGCVGWHEKEDDCIMVNPFDDDAIRRYSRVISLSFNHSCCASETLNYYVYSESFNSTVYDSKEKKEFDIKLRKLAIRHLQRFNREEWNNL